jgi:hypothetical protein
MKSGYIPVGAKHPKFRECIKSRQADDVHKHVLDFLETDLGSNELWGSKLHREKAE